MTQPYPFTHTADTWHAKASAAKRLSSSRLRGSFASDCGRRAGQVGRLNSRGLFNAGENPLRGDRADQRQTDPICQTCSATNASPTVIRCPLAVSMVLALALS